jgi:hypothetical protein
MSIYRLYTGDDGQSHIEEQHLLSHPDLAMPQAHNPSFFGNVLEDFLVIGTTHHVGNISLFYPEKWKSVSAMGANLDLEPVQRCWLRTRLDKDIRL